MTIDIEQLRRDMETYYGAAMHSGFPMAMIELSKIQRASNEELILLAKKEGVNISKYGV